MRSLIAVIFSFVLLASCSGGDSGPASPQPPDDPAVSNNPSVPDPPDSEITTSAELIDQALADGQLDHETALLYKTFAAFLDPRLPAEYAGDEPGIVDPDFLWAAKVDYFDILNLDDPDNLSPESLELQETLAPFLIPPMYSGSWWDLQQSQAAGMATSLSMSATTLPCNPLRENCPLLTPLHWKYLAGNQVNVWYQTRYETEDLAKAWEILAEIETKAWPNLTAYMGAAPLPDRGALVAFEGPDSKLDIALVNMDPQGQIHPSFLVKGCGQSSTYILINRAAAFADLGPIAVHEFMHAIQFAMPVKDCLTLRYKTLMESTANWAVDFIYGKQKQWEHQHIYAYTDDITRSLLDEDPVIRPYGAHLFPLYLTKSGDLGAVQRAWNLAAQNSQPQVFEQVVNLEDIWPQFGARLWNQPPLDELSQWDDISRKVQTGLEEINLDLAGQGQFDLVVDPYDGLPGLSARLFHVVFHDSMIRTAAFFNGFTFRLHYHEVPEFGQAVKADQLSAEQRKGAHLHALVKINGIWENSLRDWTNIPYILFPQDLPFERVDELLLVFSNSSSDINHMVKYSGLPSHFWLSNLPWATPWEGTVNLNQTTDGVTTTFSSSDIKFEPLQPVTSALIAAPYDPDGFPWMLPYGLTAGSASWSISGTDSSGCSYSGSGTKPLTPGFMPNQFILCQFVRSGPCLRGFVLDGFDQYPTSIEWEASVVCPPPDGGSTQFFGHGEFWFRLMSWQTSTTLSSDGMSISGTASDVVGDAVAGNWQLNARD